MKITITDSVDGLIVAGDTPLPASLLDSLDGIFGEYGVQYQGGNELWVEYEQLCNWEETFVHEVTEALAAHGFTCDLSEESKLEFSKQAP